MKKICLLSFVVMATAFSDVFAAALHSYQELTSAMCAGSRFVLLLDLQQCTERPDMPTGYLTPTAMMLMPETETNSRRVVTSFLHFTDRLGYPAYEYIKFTFHSDNTVTVGTRFYDPQNFKSVGIAHTINCLMGKGIEIFSSDDAPGVVH